MIPCPQCGAPNEAAYRFCGSCGFTFQAAAPAAAAPDVVATGEPAICAGCGILIAAHQAACVTCKTPRATPPLRALPQPNGGFWVAVRASFTCGACRFESPLNHFELGEGVVCTRCGIEQRYDRSQWYDLVHLAHRVGDFGSGGPEGRFPDPHERLSSRPFPRLGLEESWIEQRQHQASPGNPLCSTCRAPLVVTEARQHQLEVACSGCHARRRYELPPPMRFKQLRGALADEHEADRREVTLTQNQGAVTLSCPNCSAPLANVKEVDGLVVCGYCQVSCRISTPTHARAGHRETPTKTWWLYFDRPSGERAKLLNEARQALARAAKAQKKAENRARSQSGQARAQQHVQQQGAGAVSPGTWIRKRIAVIGVFVASVVLLPVVHYVTTHQPEAKENTAKSGVGVDTLRRFSFAMLPSEAGTLFGVAGSADMTVEFRQPGTFKQARITRGLGPSYGIDFQGGEALDTEATLARLSKLAPHRLRKTSQLYEVHIAKSLIRFDPRVFPQFRGTLQVSTWIKDNARAIAVADALLAVALYAALGDREPTAAQLRLLNGPPLSEAKRVDLALPIEKASAGFVAIFPDGACQTQTNALTSKTSLVCEMEVDHPLIDKLAFFWPNTEKAHLQEAAFVFTSAEAQRAQPLVSGCLDRALGAGEALVVDHASGRSLRSWKLHERGDRARLEPLGVGVTVAENAPTGEAPAWAARFRALVDALERCSR